MGQPSMETTQIDKLLGQLRAGDASARDELISHACARLTRLARKMLRTYPGVARWEQTDDVFQNAALRLCRALKSMTPESPSSFFNLAAVQIRRELIDLARSHYGPHGLGAHHESLEGVGTNKESPLDSPAVDTSGPERLTDWTEFHEQVEALPVEKREVFNLVWYQGLTQAEAGALLGVTERVVKWRWRAARLAIHQALNGEPPI